MTHWFSSHLLYFFAKYGYWTVFFGLLLENAGIPLPGETILITASVLARTKHQLNIFIVAGVAIIAATLGDNLGYALGRYLGCPLLARYRHIFHLEQEQITKGEQFFQRRGGVAVFFARFITGIRVLAGPIAGVLNMPWRQFLFFNALGAICWAAAVTTAAYLLGNTIERVLRHASWAIAVAAAAAILFWWLKHRRHAMA